MVIEEKLRDLLTLEKDAQLRLTKAQVEAEEIKKQGKHEALRLLEEGKSKFLQELKMERESLQKQLELFEEQVLDDSLKKMEMVKDYYFKNKEDLAEKFVSQFFRALKESK